MELCGNMRGMTVAVVTGASSGIGEATARLLAREHGAKLVLVARREDRLRALAAELGASFCACDLTEDGAPARIRAHVEERHDRLDLLVNNAGAAWRAKFADGGWENVQRHMEVNFDAVVRLTEALLPLLRRSAPSAIVNVSSTAGRVARPGSGAYSASQVRARRLVGRAGRRGGAARRPRRARAPRLHHHRGLPAAELNDNPLTRRLVSTPEAGARAILDAGPQPQGRALRAARRTASPPPRACWRRGSCASPPGPKAGDRLIPSTRPDARVSALARSHLPAGVRST